MEPKPMKETEKDSSQEKVEKARAASRKTSKTYIENHPEWHKKNKREWARKSRETDEGKAAAVQSTMKSRENHKEEYKAYMREYMREYQRKKRAEKKAAKEAAAASEKQENE